MRVELGPEFAHQLVLRALVQHGVQPAVEGLSLLLMGLARLPPSFLALPRHGLVLDIRENHPPVDVAVVGLPDRQREQRISPVR